ncbi:MAG: hypothetical protein MRK02_09280 [Candidatus Scalindua sp.]|nr:hypothetical protein [Candidatus Scalindua sp.]
MRDQFERLQKAGIPVIVVAGNHDPLSEWVTEIRFPPNVASAFRRSGGSGTGCKRRKGDFTIYGISYQVRDTRENSL